jgi:predicted glycosyltransferase involved in capsule biosynthesis
MLIDLTNITFTIPVKIDQPDRLSNVKMVVEYLRKHFDTNIIIGEADHDPLLESYAKKHDCQYYHFISEHEPLIHRTKLLNDMYKMATTDYVANYDADVILPIDNYIKAYGLLKQHDVVYPYGGDFYFLDKKEKRQFEDGEELSSFTNVEHIHRNSFGGCLFMNKDKYLSIGGENENFISWGPEDRERITRITKMGLKVTRIPGTLYHLYHNVSINSRIPHKHTDTNRIELQKISLMTKSELTHYFNSICICMFMW